MGQLRSCVVSHRDLEFKHSVEVVAETLYEAAVLRIKAMNVPRARLHLLNFGVAVKAPEVYHSVSGAALDAWLAFSGKTPKEQALKARLKEVLKS